MKLLVDLYTKNVSKIIRPYLFIIDHHERKQTTKVIALLLVDLSYGIRLLGPKKQKNTYNRGF